MPAPTRDAGVVDPVVEAEHDRGTYRITGARIVAFALVLALVWFGGLGFRKLIKPDEGRYAEIPREMVVTGDWLTPRLNGLKYFEKPPLQYWTTAIAYEAFGISEWTSRLWTALTGFVGVLVVGYTALRLYDRRTGLFAATVTASSLAYLLLAHFNTLDMGLTLFMTTTLCAVLLARDARMRETAPEGHCGSAGRAAPASSRNWMLVAWASLALATLSKGPVAVVLCGGALVVYLAIARDWTLLRMLNLMRGLALFVLIAGPWFIAVSKANREFAQFFFIHEHVERFLTTEHRREGPLWYFVPVVIVGSLPWLSLLPKAIVDGWRAAPRHGFAPERLLIAYVAVVFVFFSLSGSKLPSYVLPLFPALAILLGRTLTRIGQSSLTIHLGAVTLIAAIVIGAVVFVPLDSNDSVTAVEHFRIAASIGTGAAIVLAKRARVTTAVMTAGFAAVVGWASLLIGHETLGRGMSTYDIAQEIKPLIAPDTTIYSVGMFEHTLDFYLQRTVTLVAFEDELEFGLAQEPERGIRTLQQFTARWNADRAPLAIMADDVFATLSQQNLPMRVVARDGRRIVTGKPIAP
jgi:4-amino-4-deoxy-L-arabinose transferase-like glycosyltransferase